MAKKGGKGKKKGGAKATAAAAVDKVAALERAGAIVTKSPAQIGTAMLKVSTLLECMLTLLNVFPSGYARSRSRIGSLFHIATSSRLYATS